MKKFLVLFIASFITGMFCCYLVGITTKAESSSFDNIEFLSPVPIRVQISIRPPI